ncbi:calcium-binding protein, partial [Vibrio vulnificus]|uniref:calcium-binding protein n=1 Tax=Vibrio vulnificus TaxID=672 RepID=UPI00037028AA
QDGDDQLFGGVGNDTLTVNGSGSNTLEGGEGDDLLKVNRSVDAYYQRDHVRKAVNTFNGGQGNDRLEGSAGAETYVFNRGDGQDTINDYDHNNWSSVDGWNQVDRIVLGEGISRDELTLRRNGNHMVLMIGGLDSGDSITIENAYTDKRYRIEEVVLSDGTTLAPQDIPLYTIDGDNDIRGGGFAETDRIEEVVLSDGTTLAPQDIPLYTIDGDNDIRGGGFAETVTVGDGNDTISLEGGNDTIRSGGGVDTVDAGSGDDEVYAGLGDDTVLAGSGNDLVYGEEGNDTLHG